ncbi:MAG: hypothetical protein KatS3mg105_4818 [Gemmatales bacterium]|nr:MAG: hypothetical protein KatS3mg105_4818 [Gemmatales bacterium]
MKRIGLLLVVVLLSSRVGAATLDEARTRWLKGNYEEARELYEQLAKNAKYRASATVGISRTWQSQGDYDKALKVVDDALELLTKDASLLARRAELLYLRGRWDEAEKAANQAIKLANAQLLARWVRAQIYRDRGEFTKADDEFRWFVRYYNDHDIDSPEDLLLVGLAGCENARWNKLSDQFEFILNEVYRDALKLDKNFWPAELHAGLLLLEKYNRAEAIPAFDKALSINPRAAEAYVGKGIASLQKYDLKNAELFAEQALKINPNLVEALHLRADLHLAAGAVNQALANLRKAHDVNPRDEQTLGRIAAVFLLQRKQGEFDKIAKKVESFDPKPGEFYRIVGETLEERRRFLEAEKFFKRSVELRPFLPWARNRLGLLYMRLGKEDVAQKVLAEAFEADEFNVRVSNSLKVLRHLAKYKTIKTKHFHLRFDPENDAHLAKFMSRYLEETYDTLAAEFKYQPAGPILVEVFNNHEMFSGRTIALPDLHTIGACTGRVVAMVSPRGRGVARPFNWARVLRHELVHIFNLEQTRFQVPHWFTEGLAVISEGFPRPQLWNDILRRRVSTGDLLDLENINLAFIRPRSPEEWNLAYCQSQLYVEYMKEHFGRQTVGGMLQAYADGLDTDSAIRQVCQVEIKEFEKGYQSYVKKIVLSMEGGSDERPRTIQELRAEIQKKPDDPDLAALLAEHYLRRDKAEARKLAESVLKQNPNHPRACYVKAVLLRAGGEDQEALKMLQAGFRSEKFDAKLYRLLGQIYYDSRRFAEAADIFEKARQHQPHQSYWLNQLVKVYAQTNRKEKLIEVYEAIVPMDADDLDSRKELARLLLETGQPQKAVRYAWQALEIDVLDPAVQLAYGQGLLGVKRFADAVEPLELAATLYDRSSKTAQANDARVALARAYMGLKQKDKAIQIVVRVLARDPDHLEAKKLQKELEKMP